MDGMTSFAASSGTTFSFITTETARLLTLLERPASTGNKDVGVQAVLSSTTIATVSSISSFATTSRSIQTKSPQQTKRITANGRASPSCVARAACRATQTFSTTTTVTA